MNTSTPQRVQRDLGTATSSQPRQQPPPPSRADVRDPVTTLPVADPDVRADDTDIDIARARHLIPSQQSRLPRTVRLAPRLWSILYDGLSARDQRWVLDTIERYRQA